MARSKEGIYGTTYMRSNDIIGKVVVCNGRFNNIKGEVISRRKDHIQYLTVQVPSEFKDRVYILHLSPDQCKNTR